jgi:hypothetical protein
MPVRHTNESFIEKATKVHKGVYEYVNINYVNSDTIITAVCSLHGEFKQRAGAHLRGFGCQACGKIKNSAPITHSHDYVLGKFRDKHGDRYDYSKVVYKNANTPVDIICPDHGLFKMPYSAHYTLGRGCKKCKPNKNYSESNHAKRKVEWENIIKSVWGDNKFDLSESGYANSVSTVRVKCLEHNKYFETKATILSRGFGGCEECNIERVRANNNKKLQKSFVARSSVIHDNFYNYENVYYINSITPVNIICPVHGEFQQKPGGHLRGSGCVACCNSQGETRISKYLNSLNCEYKIQKYIKDDSYRYYFDFFVPSLNLMIEFDGKQHFEPIKFFGGEKAFEETQERDQRKNRYCRDHNIELVRIPYYDFDNIEAILESKLKLTQ